MLLQPAKTSVEHSWGWVINDRIKILGINYPFKQYFTVKITLKVPVRAIHLIIIVII